MSPDAEPPVVGERFAPTLLEWAEGNRRDLPWRRTRDPWAILVSEAMLQQTQVARVVPIWAAFLDRFPDPASCAAAATGEVIERWAGLGYNRRAVNLHRAAVAVCARHGGSIPEDLADLLALPGVGPYTARAVLAFAFERDIGVLDTNAARLLARAVAGRPLGVAEAQRLADDVVPPGSAWSWNQGVLDLGATVCVSRRPRCPVCPLGAAGACAWAAAGGADPAVGSAGVSGRQSAFAGSDRQGRGRLVAALRAGPLPAERLADVTGWVDDPARSARLAAGLVADGLAVVGESGALHLPG